MTRTRLLIFVVLFSFLSCCSDESEIQRISLPDKSTLVISAATSYEMRRPFHYSILDPKGTSRTHPLSIGSATPRAVVSFSIVVGTDSSKVILIENSCPGIALALYDTASGKRWPSEDDTGSGGGEYLLREWRQFFQAEFSVRGSSKTGYDCEFH